MERQLTNERLAGQQSRIELKRTLVTQVNKLEKVIPTYI